MQIPSGINPKWNVKQIPKIIIFLKYSAMTEPVKFIFLNLQPLSMFAILNDLKRSRNRFHMIFSKLIYSMPSDYLLRAFFIETKMIDTVFHKFYFACLYITHASIQHISSNEKVSYKKIQTTFHSWAIESLNYISTTFRIISIIKWMFPLNIKYIFEEYLNNRWEVSFQRYNCFLLLPYSEPQL